MIRGGRRATTVAALLLLVAAVGAGCSDDRAGEPAADPDRVVLKPAPEGADHTHAPGQEHGGAPVGDGQSPAAGGYRMTAVRLPGAGQPGEVSFRILDKAGDPVTSYVEEQTKLLHLYVVREDLSAFRHVHPTLGDDGTWRGRVDLGVGGPWRVVAEFAPEGAPQAVVLGTTIDVPGDSTEVPVPRDAGATVADDGVVRVRLLGTGTVSDNGRLRIAVTNLDDQPLALGSYLGAAAHLTGFVIPNGRADASGGFVHVHPYGAPEVTDDGTVLTFHTTFSRSGDYRMFVQVRVDGLLHQVAVTVPVS